MDRVEPRLGSGNEAIAQGAWEAGVRVGAGYPGTPSTEILEALARLGGVDCEWSPNEKVALEVAVGAWMVFGGGNVESGSGMPANEIQVEEPVIEPATPVEPETETPAGAGAGTGG